MPPSETKNKRVELVSGGKKVNGRFVPNIEPTISATELTSPVPRIDPPVPALNMNDGSRTTNLVGNVANQTQTFIGENLESRKKAAELASLLGEQTTDAAAQRQALSTEYGLPDNLARLQDIQLQLNQANTASDMTKTRIEGAAGQTLGQAGREVTQEDRENAVRTAGIAAEAAVLQGNIETASTLINQAMSDYYSDRQLQNQNMIQQLEYFQGVADDETAQLLEQEKRKYLEDQAKIENLKASIESALLSGASQSEVRQLSGSQLSDDEKLGLAQMIVARGASEMRDREEELALARDLFESESTQFGSGTVTLDDGTKAVVTNDGLVTPVSQINFYDPAQVDALPVSDLTKAIISGIGKTKDLTPTQKGEVLSELQSVGFNPNTYIVNKLSSLVQTWAQLPDTSRGYVEGLKFWESKTDADVARFESQRMLLTREIARLFDVGVLSDQDVASYKDAMPSRQDSDISVVINKAAGIGGAATGTNTDKAGAYYRLPDGRTAVVGLDGETLLDPATGLPIE